MFRFLTLVLLLFFSTLLASDKVEIFASTLNIDGDIIKAEDGVVVSYKDYLLSSKSAVYNKKNGDLELFGNIKATYFDGYRVLGNYARLNIIKKEKLFKPFYILDKKTDVWISAKEGCSKDKYIDIKSGIVSGCNQNNPLWKMEFSSSDYNSQTKWLNLYNTTLYIYDIAVLYMPYIGYSLDTTRRSGLLLPSVGVSGAEGFFYQQPVYIAPYNSWDLELKPQIRTLRGSGIYSNFRFVDSYSSKGSLKFGYFKEKDSYYKENNLANNEHYGYNFSYINSNLLNSWFNQNFDGQSGLFVNINNMNDVDYINLRKNNSLNTDTSIQILSNINLFYNTNFNYIATYFKYYQDLSKSNNKDTLQQLPTLHYHHYLDDLVKNNYLSYSFDLKSTNIYREVGSKVIQTDMNLPIKLQTSIFDELVNISYTSNLYTQYSKFDTQSDATSLGLNFENGYFIRNFHTFNISTELVKPYENYIHTISLSANYTNGGAELKKGYYDDYGDFCLDPANASKKECEFYNISNIDESLTLEFVQNIYDSTAKHLFYHRLAQKIDYNTDSNNRYGELENEFEFNINRWFSIYSDTLFNFDEHDFSKILNQINFKGFGFDANVAHLYKNSFIADEDYASYLTSKASYTYNTHYTYEFRYDYDIQTGTKKGREIGFLYKKRCLNFGLKYVESNIPILTQSGESSVYDKYLYVTIILKPLMPYKKNSSNIAIKLTK